jgi:hypothetical protein
MITLITEVSYNIIWSTKRFSNSIKHFQWKNELTKQYYGDKYLKKMLEYLGNESYTKITKLNPLIDMAYKAKILTKKELVLINSCYGSAFYHDNSKVYKDNATAYFSCDIIDDELKKEKINFGNTDLKIVYTDRVALMFMDDLLLDFMKKNSKKIRDVLVNKFSIWLTLR